MPGFHPPDAVIEALTHIYSECGRPETHRDPNAGPEPAGGGTGQKV